MTEGLHLYARSGLGFYCSMTVKGSPTLSTCLEREAEHRAALWVGSRPDVPAMRLDDRPTDRETHPHAVRLGRHKRLKQPAGPIRRQARPGIRNTDFDQTQLFERRRQGDLPPRAPLQRFGGIADQVHQHLLDLNPVDQPKARPWINMLDDLDAV